MSCKYLTIRLRKGKYYVFCRLNKQEIEYCECKVCTNKIYREYKSKKKQTHTQTKATAIQKGVKDVVWVRDGYRCIFCGKKVPKINANAHFIPRSQGGLGIEKNIFTACDECHSKQDNGLYTKKMEEEAEAYLRNCYIDWNKSDLIYSKWD